MIKKCEITSLIHKTNWSHDSFSLHIPEIVKVYQYLQSDEAKNKIIDDFKSCILENAPFSWTFQHLWAELAG